MIRWGMLQVCSACRRAFFQCQGRQNAATTRGACLQRLRLHPVGISDFSRIFYRFGAVVQPVKSSVVLDDPEISRVGETAGDSG
jgi:hypothetical protein